MRMNFRLFIALSFLGMAFTPVFGEHSVPNVIYLSFDGLSPQSLTILMNKKKLPHFHKFAMQGSMQILKGTADKPSLKDALAVLWTGYPTSMDMSHHDSAFVFNRLKKNVPDLTTIVMISRPKQTMPKEKEWGTILKRPLMGIDKTYDEKARTSDDITQGIIDSIRSTKGPFIIFANYPLAAQYASYYREGCGRYAECILYLNKQIGLIQKELKDRGLKNNTVFVLTASYTFIQGSQMPSSKSWVICSKPLKKGTSVLDLVPTIYELYGQPVSEFTPPLPGNSLL